MLDAHSWWMDTFILGNSLARQDFSMPFVVFPMSGMGVDNCPFSGIWWRSLGSLCSRLWLHRHRPAPPGKSRSSTPVRSTLPIAADSSCGSASWAEMRPGFSAQHLASATNVDIDRRIGAGRVIRPKLNSKSGKACEPDGFNGPRWAKCPDSIIE